MYLHKKYINHIGDKITKQEYIAIACHTSTEELSNNIREKHLL